MRFDLNDLNDARVADSSFERYYPADVNEAPDAEGVYVFTDKTAEVLYAGKSCGQGLKAEIVSKRNSSADREAKRFRWFVTKSDADAEGLKTDWVAKYTPKFN
ncbi:MAG: hypothetical protein A3G34_01640 [Candidatus Lindowbacteria bacterium RIFCSPLOWO2_12_FULL_62_27]|nr:MAG: hypothetical protein A3I06_05580 [Candidatus Lindowbacteria bacterium RIFCSPLOWO2_02_FULL_62_12]OGH59013.1 MAG: hypothetical protein A3G34_01640 [Candidatus Lindowbacteria bacterium RIFCSPLOWO2_12_FULL_62_27]